VVIAYLALRLWVLGAIAPISARNDWTRTEWILTIPGALAQFLLLLLLPWRAGPGHEMRPADGIWSPAFWLPTLGISATGAALWLLFRHHRHRRLYLFCAVWIVVALTPVLNLRSLDPVETIRDRFLFMSSVAWCIFLGDFVSGFAVAGGVRARLATAAAAALAIAYFSYLWRAEHFWHDQITYFSSCVQNYPQSWVCRTNLGMELWHTGDLKGAERELETAALLRPREGVLIGDLASLHVVMGKLDHAKEEFTREIEVWKDAPVAVYVELAEVSAQQGDRKTSEQILERAASMPGGRLEAAKASAKIKIHVDRDYASAETALKQIPPEQRDTDTWVLLASMARRERRLEEALTYYDSALKLAPRRIDLIVGRVSVLYRLGRRDEALHQSELALSRDPNNPDLKRLVDRLRSLAKGQ
jgi:tetratricopeptide (TPR) repeat protein